MLGDDETIPYEIELKNKFKKILMDKGIDQKKAKKMSNEFFYNAIKKIIELPPVPENFGDFLLQNEKNNEDFKQMLANRWAIGVTEQEIRDWWNKSGLERRMIRQVFEMDLKSAFIYFRSRGLSYEEAGEHVRKNMIVYGEVELDINLPYEWKDKVDSLILYAITNNLERVKEESKLYPSMNEYVRCRLICKNKLAN